MLKQLDIRTVFIFMDEQLSNSTKGMPSLLALCRLPSLCLDLERTRNKLFCSIDSGSPKYSRDFWHTGLSVWTSSRAALSPSGTYLKQAAHNVDNDHSESL